MIHFYLNSYKIPACKVICTEIVSQELLTHRSSANFQVVKLYLNSCKIRLLQFFYFSLCGVSDTQTCGEMRVLFVLGQPSAEIARVGWTNMWCGEMRNFFARSNRLRRSCVSNAQTCGGMWISFGHGQPSAEIAQVRHPNMWQNMAKCKFGEARRSPFARNEGQPSKTGAKLWFWKFRCKRGMKVKRQ